MKGWTRGARRAGSPVIAVVGCLAPALAGQSAAPQAAPADPPAQVAAGLPDAAKEEFLRTARFVRRETLSVGITGSQRATLSDGRLSHDAHIQAVDETTLRIQRRTRRVITLRDSFELNIAAYRLDRLLGLGLVPVSVERRVDGRRAAVTWWVDGVLMMESERISGEVPPPDPASWADQMHQARLFNQLIFNTDRNPANFLIDGDWRLWLVDFTRAFRPYRRLPEPESVERIDRRLYRGLRALRRATLQEAADGYLTRPEVDSVMARRDLLLELLERRIARRGEAAVICDLPGH